MAYVKWDTSLETGDASVDSQHQNLYAIVNELHEAIEQERGQEAVALVLVRVLLHTKTHFHDEEALMQRVNFPDIARHKQLHADFEREAEALSEEYLAGAEVSPETLVEFLQDWLATHIDDEDRRIVSHIGTHPTR